MVCRTVLWSRNHILAFVAEDLEGFVEDRSQLGKDREAANVTAFVMLDFWLRDAHPVHFPIDCRRSNSQGEIVTAMQLFINA